MERSICEPEEIKFGVEGRKEFMNKHVCTYTCVCVFACVCLTHAHKWGWLEERYHVKFRYEIIWRCEMGKDKSIRNVKD